jgi:4-amino-4-deoxy-L-arabinose transferase-like glycosyltransferase
MTTNASKAVKKLRSNRLAATVVGLASLSLTIPYAFRDPEPHHDGVQYAAALGVSQGLEIQSEIFSQYGPVTAWLQGFTLWLFGPELIWIRLLNAILIVCIALFMQAILRRTIHNFVVPFLIPLAWVASNPDWSVADGVFQFWPWPSVLFEFFAIAALFLWIKSTECSLERSYLYLFAAGLVIGVSGFTRSQNGLLLYLALASAMTAISYKLPTWKKQVLFLSAGTFVSSITIILYFVLKGSLDDFINQANYWLCQ